MPLHLHFLFSMLIDVPMAELPQQDPYPRGSRPRNSDCIRPCLSWDPCVTYLGEKSPVGLSKLEVLIAKMEIGIAQE